MKKLIFLVLLLSSSAQATSIESCVAAEVTDSHGAKLTFSQHAFENGEYDLVVEQSPDDIKRVTFVKSHGCAYQALAIAEGIGWGWHLAWADDNHIYYARMDGEAWVSSVPKKIAVENTRELRFTQNAGLLTLNWQAGGASYSMQSGDEGRSWRLPAKN
jgi:hypothetical protein